MVPGRRAAEWGRPRNIGRLCLRGTAAPEGGAFLFRSLSRYNRITGHKSEFYPVIATFYREKKNGLAPEV